MEDDVFTRSIVDERGGDGLGDIGEGGRQSEPLDEHRTNAYPDPDTDGRNEVEQADLFPAAMPPRLEHKPHIQDVGGQVRQYERDPVPDAKMNGAHMLRNRLDLHVEQPHQDIVFSQRGEEQPRHEKESGHVDSHRRSTAYGVLEKLNARVVLFVQDFFQTTHHCTI